MDEIKIEKNIPIPKQHWREKYPLGQMEVGDSFFIRNKIVQAKSAVSYYGKRNGKKFCTRSEGDGIRIWRIE